MTKTNFMKEFIFDLHQNPCTLKYLAKYHLTKALKKLFKELDRKNELKDNQIIGILLKLKFDNGSIKTVSTFRKGSKESLTKFSTLFKHLLILRSENLSIDSKENIKVSSIIFNYHIYPMDYTLSDVQDNELFLKEQNEIKKDNTSFIDYKEQAEIKFMDPLKIFKIPLSYAGSSTFQNDFKTLNKNVSMYRDKDLKYRIIYKTLSNLETEIRIVLQEDSTIVIFKFKDRLIVLPKLVESEIIIERTIMSKSKEIYIIDILNHQILLIKKFNCNTSTKGYIKALKLNQKFDTNDLKKFITFDIESITDLNSLKNEGDQIFFDPLLISAYDFCYNKIYSKIIKENLYVKENIPVSSDSDLNKNIRKIKIESLELFFLQFIDVKYHKFRLYAHNLSSYDGILIFESLFHMCEKNGFKIEPMIRDNKIISIKIRFGWMGGNQNKYRYHIEFHDSMLLLLSSLEKLGKTFLSENKDLQKLIDPNVKELLLDENVRNNEDFSLVINKLTNYCVQDSIALAYIINKFSEIIYGEFKLNIHNYPTASSLALALYLSNHLKNDSLIPLIAGSTYKDIKKAFHGGHTDVYQLYSNEEVHSYDYISMYPTQMLEKPMPVGLPTKFVGNPLLTGETLESLIKTESSVQTDDNLLYETLQELLYNSCTPETSLNEVDIVRVATMLRNNPDYSRYYQKMQDWAENIPSSNSSIHSYKSSELDFLVRLKNELDSVVNSPIVEIDNASSIDLINQTNNNILIIIQRKIEYLHGVNLSIEQLSKILYYYESVLHESKLNDYIVYCNDIFGSQIFPLM
jgi:hypothetical protein